jgi:hypothetical protein
VTICGDAAAAGAAAVLSHFDFPYRVAFPNRRLSVVAIEAVKAILKDRENFISRTGAVFGPARQHVRGVTVLRVVRLEAPIADKLDRHLINFVFFGASSRRQCENGHTQQHETLHFYFPFCLMHDRIVTPTARDGRCDAVSLRHYIF